MKGVFASTEAIVGALAFSLFFLAFSVSSLLSQTSASKAITNEAAYINMNARLQHSLFLIDRLGMNMSQVISQLDYDIGARNYSITPFASPYASNYPISRIAAIGNRVYYINVDINES